MRCQTFLWDNLASAVACTYPNSKKDAGGGMVVRSELAVGLGMLSLPRPRPASRKLMMTRRKKGSALSRRRDCALAMGRDEGKIKSVEGGMCESRAS